MSNGAAQTFIRRSIERSLKDLPALPSSVMEVVRETNRPDPSAVIVEEHVSSDQALTAKLLRVVNSAYYGLSGQVSAVSQAIVILGLQQVRNLVLSVGAVSLFESASPKRREIIKQFWMHSFATAALAQIIGQQQRLDPQTVETIFVGGLLHDIGRLYLFCNFTTAYEQVLDKAAQEKGPVENWERELLGVDHAKVGEQMAQNWNFPTVLAEMIGMHEGPFDGTESMFLYTVHVADALTKTAYGGAFAEAEYIDPVALESLGIDEHQLADLRASAVKVAQEAAVSYGLMAA